MKILVTGAAGMLGTAVLDRLSADYQVIASDREVGFSTENVEWITGDLLNFDDLRKTVVKIRPDVVVHCAAIVNVDACEKDTALATDLHANTTRVIGEVLNEWGSKLIYISTDSVFNGKKDGLYEESDPVDPPNVYARTKYEGEVAVSSACTNHVILRTNIFGWSRAERISFAEWVIKGLLSQNKLTMFTDVSYTPIHVSHLAEIISDVIDKDVVGLYHAVGSTNMSKYDFAMLVGEVFGISTDCVEPISVDDIGLAANRPKNMSLLNSKLSERLGRKIPEAIEGVKLLKEQYDGGWLKNIKGRELEQGYKFWS